MSSPDTPQDEPRRTPPDRDAPPGGEGDEHPDGPPLPFAPDKDDDSPLGDSDQHSDA